MSAPGPAPGGPWLTTEVALIHSHYPQGGAQAVRALLPHRTLSAIRAKAAAMRVACQRASTLGKRYPRRYEQRDDIDNMIREGYIHATGRGAVKALAERIGRPAWWVQKRAARFGLTRTNRTRLDCWVRAELDLLEQWASAGLDVIVRKLREAGFKRTPTAVGIKLKRLKIDRSDPDVWSAPDLAQMLGVSASTVADWIARRGLVARREEYGPFGRFMVHRKDVRRWIKANPQFIDLRRVDAAWFWDVMFSPSVGVPRRAEVDWREAA